MAKRTQSEQRLEKYDASIPDRTPGDRWVTMSNALARAGHGLTLSEKRIICCAVSKLDSRAQAALKPGAVLRTRITAQEYAATFEVDPNTAYDQLKAGVDHLWQRQITFFRPTELRDGEPLQPTVVTMRWIGEKARYEGKEAWIELAWWPALVPHLTGIRRQFTSYQLKQASALRSVYSWKLLELLTRFKSSGEAEYTIEDFRKSMDATEKQAKDFAKIRSRMIEPAVKELREKDGWLIEWRPVLGGRRVKAVHFSFERDPQLSLPLGTPDHPPAALPLGLDEPERPRPARRRSPSRVSSAPEPQPAPAEVLADPHKDRRSPPAGHLEALKASLRGGNTKPEITESTK